MKALSRILTAALCLCLVCGIAAPASAEPFISDKVSVGSVYSFVLDDEARLEAVRVYLDGLLSDRGYVCEGRVFVSVEALCALCSLYPEQSMENNILKLSWPGFEIEAEQGAGYLFINKRCCYAPAGFILRGGRAFLPLEAVEWIFNVSADFSAALGRVDIDTSGIGIVTGWTNYYDESFNFEDLYWLSHIISAEAADQPLECKIGVGNVVLNRLHSDIYPNTVYDVIYDTQNAIQFSPTLSTKLSKNPTEESLAAAYLCLEGFNTVGESMYFINPSLASDYWLKTAKLYVGTIGELDFYSER